MDGRGIGFGTQGRFRRGFVGSVDTADGDGGFVGAGDCEFRAGGMITIARWKVERFNTEGTEKKSRALRLVEYFAIGAP